MAFENDPEGRRLAEMYAGHNFDRPNIVQHTVFNEYNGEWTADEFMQMMNGALASIPRECLSTAKVEMFDAGYDSSTRLRLTYEGIESAATVADRVRRCELYVEASRRDERAAYERLRVKFANGQSPAIYQRNRPPTGARKRH